MKKKYNKPTVDIMEINGNDIICASCSAEGKIPVATNQNYRNIFEEILDDNEDGLTRDEFNRGFGKVEDCSIHIDLYCKFTSQGSGITQIAWS